MSFLHKQVGGLCGSIILPHYVVGVLCSLHQRFSDCSLKGERRPNKAGEGGDLDGSYNFTVVLYPCLNRLSQE